MAAAPFTCSVITPEARVFDGPADFGTIPAHDGEIGILRDRAPLLARLGAGRLVVRRGDEERTWFIDGGFAQVLDNKVIVLTSKAIEPAKIDRGTAARDLEAARSISAVDEVALRRKERLQESARARLRLAK